MVKWRNLVPHTYTHSYSNKKDFSKITAAPSLLCCQTHQHPTTDNALIRDKCDKDRRFQSAISPEAILCKPLSELLWWCSGGGICCIHRLSSLPGAWLQNWDTSMTSNMRLKSPQNQTACLWPSTFPPGPSLDVFKFHPLHCWLQLLSPSKSQENISSTHCGLGPLPEFFARLPKLAEIFNL